jgi:hypothetical protein
MATARYTVGRELTPERRLSMKSGIKAAASRPYAYDPDSPLITAETVKIADLSPEQIKRIKAAQKRHAAIDPFCVNLTLEEFVNWHPVGGIPSDEPAMHIKEAGVIDSEIVPVMAV